MCGIFGLVAERQELLQAVKEDATLRALHHRGPDGQGAFRGHTSSTGCVLLHTRLAIIDLSPGGQQPMRSADGRYVITYNGEIYNYREVRRELEQAGATFRSASDTEVILQAFEHWGPSSLDRLRGMFAFGIWDSKLGDLFLARDRLGIKPLYYSTLPSGLAFASETRALVASGLVPRTISSAGVRSYLEWGSVAEPHTILENVVALPPGSFLVRRDGALTQWSYWRPPSQSDSSMTTAGAACEELAPVLREAVKLRLVADVPVGVFLSGGIDSAAITTLAASASDSRLHTFTIGFQEARANESVRAGKVATELGTVHHDVLLSPQKLLVDLDSSFDAQDQPSADGTNTYFVSQAVRRAGISVALSGLGGDEVFAGYHYFRQFSSAIRWAGAGSSWLGGKAQQLVGAPYLPGIPRGAPKVAELLTGPPGPDGAYTAFRCMFTRSQLDKLLTLAGSSSRASVARPLTLATDSDGGAVDAVNAMTQYELANYLRNTLLRDADVMSMAHGLEVRVPLLDHRLVEAALRIPGHLKLSPSTNKPLLVGACPGLPSFTRGRSKMGFSLPFDEWLRGPLNATVDDFLSARSIEMSGVLRADYVRSLWAAFQRGDRRVTFSRVWSLVSLARWIAGERGAA